MPGSHPGYSAVFMFMGTEKTLLANWKVPTWGIFYRAVQKLWPRGAMHFHVDHTVQFEFALITRYILNSLIVRSKKLKFWIENISLLHLKKLNCVFVIMNQQVYAWMPPAALRGPLRGAFCYRRAYFITSSLASWQVSVKQIIFGTIFFKLYRTIKEFQIAPRDQCKFKLYRVVNVKVHCTVWSVFLHRAKKGTHEKIWN